MSERFARIDEASDWLGPWLGSAAGGTVALRAPGDDAKTTLGCVLIGLADAPQRAGTTARFRARYLVWANPADATAQKRLSGIAFAALAERSWLDVELAPAADAFALAPGRVGLVIGVPIEAVPPPAKDPLVTKPLVLRRAPLGDLVGVVLADGDQPLARAVVEIPALSLTTVTDGDGRFRFGAIPAGVDASLVVRARGRELAVAATSSSLTIDFPIAEP